MAHPRPAGGATARLVVRGPSPGPPQDGLLSGDGLEPVLDDAQTEGYAQAPVGPTRWRPSDYRVKPAGAAANHPGGRFIHYEIVHIFNTGSRAFEAVLRLGRAREGSADGMQDQS